MSTQVGQSLHARNLAFGQQQPAQNSNTAVEVFGATALGAGAGASAAGAGLPVLQKPTIPLNELTPMDLSGKTGIIRKMRDAKVNDNELKKVEKLADGLKLKEKAVKTAENALNKAQKSSERMNQAAEGLGKKEAQKAASKPKAIAASQLYDIALQELNDAKTELKIANMAASKKALRGLSEAEVTTAKENQRLAKEALAAKQAEFDKALGNKNLKPQSKKAAKQVAKTAEKMVDRLKKQAENAQKAYSEAQTKLYERVKAHIPKTPAYLKGAGIGAGIGLAAGAIYALATGKKQPPAQQSLEQ